MKNYDIAYLRGSDNLSKALLELPFKIVDRRSGEVLGVVVPAGALKRKKVVKVEKVEKVVKKEKPTKKAGQK